MKSSKLADTRGGHTRRSVLKGAAAAAGATAVTGFPTVWAQNIKDITLVHAGGSYSAIKEIADQASKDLGFTVEMQAIDPSTQLNRSLTQPKTIDINDMPTTTIAYLVGKGVLQELPVSKFKWFDKMIPLLTKNEYPDGTKCSDDGYSPLDALYYTDASGDKLANEATAHLAGAPIIYNADTLGIRPDLLGGKTVASWADLLDPAYKGKAALVDYAPVGIIDVAMALEARGEMTYADKGDMTREEIDKTIDIMIELKRGGHFRAFWSNFDQSVNLMASGEVVIQSMWSPAVTAVRARGIDCYYAPLKEGYRGWVVMLSPMAHLEGIRLDAAIEYMNWYLSGWQGGFIAKQGYYSAVPETAKEHMTADEWGYWYEGKAAAADILDPYGNVMEKQGSVRDGGGLWDRMGNIACWNTVMTEDRRLTRRWNEFISA